MNWHEAENKLKLHLLHSLARSQRALARIIESMAAVAEGKANSGSSEAAAEKVVEQLEAISRYQRQLTEKISGVRIRKFRRGLPGKPWLNDSLKRLS
jgi:two-component sensor histidine kinase